MRESIPYTNGEIRERVSFLFNENPIPVYSINPLLPQGIFIAYPRESVYFEYRKENELIDLARSLPQDHEVKKEIILQAKEVLENVTLRSSEELRNRIASYENICSMINMTGEESLLVSMKAVADYILGKKTDLEVPEEAAIIFTTTVAMLGYAQNKPRELEIYLERLWEEKISLPCIISGYAKLKNKKAIEIYFETFARAKGNTEFMIGNSRKCVEFKFIGRHFIKKSFPEYDFQKDIENMPLGLQEPLKEILINNKKSI